MEERLSEMIKADLEEQPKAQPKRKGKMPRKGENVKSFSEF